MNKVLYIILIFLFSLTVISCTSSSDEDDIDEIMTTDTTAATLAEATFVTTPTNDSTPDYTFHLMRQVLSPMEVPVLQVPLLLPLATIPSL